MRRGALWVATAIALVLAPVLTAPWRDVAGDAYVDAWGTQWFYWFAGEVLVGRQAFAHTDLLFFPWGKDVYLHTGGNLLDALLAWPLFAALPGPLAWNAWIALVLAGNAWAGTRLAAALGVPEGRRWTAGVALVLNPYVLQEIAFGRPTQAVLLFAGLAAAGLWSMRTAREAALAGVFLALTGWTYWFHGMVLGALAVGYGLWRIAAGPDRAPQLGLHLLAGAVCLALALPPAWPMLQAVAAGEVPGLLALDGTGLTAPLALRTMEGDAEGLWVLAPFTGAGGSLFEEDGLRFHAGMPVLLGVHAIVAVVGGVAALRARGLRAAGWVPLWIVGALWLGVGPLLQVGESWVRNTPWLAMVSHVDVLRRWWWPGRAVFAAHLALAALVPFALLRWPRVVGAGLLVGALVQLWTAEILPLRTWDGTPSRVLRCLAGAPGGAVIDVPWASDQKNLWFQTEHHHPILGGMLVRKEAFGPPELVALREQNRLLGALTDIGERRYTASLEHDEADRAALLELGYRYVLARVDHFRRPRVGRDGGVEWTSDWSRAQRLLERTMGGPPVAIDEQVAVWTLDGSTVGCE